MIDAAALPSFASGVVVKFKRDEFIVTFFDILGLVQKSEKVDILTASFTIL